MPASNWEQLESRLKAVALALQEGHAAPEEPAPLIQEIVSAAVALSLSHQYDTAIELLERALKSFPDDPKLRRHTALAYGGKGEWGLGLADRFGVPPRPARLSLFQALFERAVQVDPTVPDPHWDLAVLKTRFTQDFGAAAQHFVDAQQLGYDHPMMPRLAMMIQQGLKGAAPPRVPDDSGETQLKQLIWALVLWPQWPADGAAVDLAQPSVPAVEEPFDSYCRRAAQLVREGKLDVAGFEQVRAATHVLQGDAAEDAADLLRVTAAGFGDPAVLAEATDTHLRILANMSFALRGRVKESPRWLVRARRVALRGLKIVETAPVKVDSDVHAELLLALGQTYTHPSAYQLREGMRYYLQALDLKEAAANVPDIARLRDLLRQIIEYETQQVLVALSGFGGIGSALTDLEAGYAAAKRYGNTLLTARVGILLATAYSAVHQPLNGETVLREVLAFPGLPDEQRLDARFQLASALSESGRAEAALEIQEDLLVQADQVLPLSKSPVFWLNLGNSRRVTGKIEAAREAFTKALSLVKPPAPNEVQSLRGHILSLLGQVEFLLGRPRQGAALFQKAEGAFGVLPSLDALRFRTLASEQFFKAGQYKRCRYHLERARNLLEWHLSRGASLPVWESVLQSWSALDAYDVESLLKGKRKEARRNALVRAESAKGRLLAWLRNLSAPKGAAEALKEERHREALANAQTWVNAAAGRVVLSVFAAERGLAVFALGKGENLGACWIDDFRYEAFRTECFEPWEDIVARSMSGEQGLWPFANLLTNYLLERVGEWLWRAVPDLAKGGEELVIVPHRLFRSLPLAHCRLPRGRSLSELFQRVTIAPSLFDLAAALQAPKFLGYKPLITALVDPDATLPFARLEGFSAAGHENTLAHGAATAESLCRAVGSPGIVLVSAHGDFREDNPWNSLIQASDAPLELQHLLDRSLPIHAHVVVLGVCEAGKTRRSVSDEPLGFPSVLAQGGVSAVVAPMWKVDDFASLFFITHLFDRLREQTTPARAVVLTAQWMRRLTAKEALAYFDGLSQQLQYMQHPAINAALQQVQARVRRNRDWLEQLPPDRRPFHSPLDWAAFQVVGSPL